MLNAEMLLLCFHRLSAGASSQPAACPFVSPQPPRPLREGPEAAPKEVQDPRGGWKLWDPCMPFHSPEVQKKVKK